MNRKRLSSLAALLSLGLFACNSTESPPDTQPLVEPTSVTHFALKHMHFGAASLKADPAGDLPDSLLTTLNSIPGKFGGSPQADHEFQRLMASNAVLRVNWDSLILGGHLGSPALYSDSQPFQSLSPASVRIMRIGTFLGSPDDGAVFPDSAQESYGFYSVGEDAQVMAVYFDAPVGGVGVQALCDGTPVQAELKITKAGLYFLVMRFDGTKITYSMVTDPGDLIFAVFTHSQANRDFLSELMGRISCKAD